MTGRVRRNPYREAEKKVAASVVAQNGQERVYLTPAEPADPTTDVRAIVRDVVSLALVVLGAGLGLAASFALWGVWGGVFTLAVVLVAVGILITV